MQALLFIGLPGAGKSTFYRSRYFDTHFRINLDQLKTRNREAILLRACIEAKARFVWDNTNPTRASRDSLLSQLHAAHYETFAFYFEPNFDASWRRNEGRHGKARVPFAAIKSVAAQLEKPSWDEGYTAIFSVWNLGNFQFKVEEWTREI